MEAERILSADSHLIEAADIWTARSDKRFLDRAPRVIKNFGGRQSDFFAAEGPGPFAIVGEMIAAVSKMIADNVAAPNRIGQALFLRRVGLTRETCSD
jgi:hypothetical protein